MASVTVTEDIKRGIRQLRELEDRFLNGSIDPRVCRSSLQDIIQGKSSLVSIFVQQVERQLARWQEVGVAINQETREFILEQAKQFAPSSLTDGPLVSGGFGYVLPGSINRLWDAITPPTGFHKTRYMDAKISLRFESEMKPLQAGLRLIHFDPNSYQGLSPEDALVRAKSDGVRLAGIEVLEKILVDPDYCNRWNGGDWPFPNLSGLQAKYGSDWSLVPDLSRWSTRCSLRLLVKWAGFTHSHFASPTVREC